MFRKPLAALLIGASSLVGIGASVATAAPRPRCAAAVERKAAINARIAATNANITALTAARSAASAAGRARAVARLDVRLAVASRNLGLEQQHLVAYNGRCP